MEVSEKNKNGYINLLMYDKVINYWFWKNINIFLVILKGNRYCGFYKKINIYGCGFGILCY